MDAVATSGGARAVRLGLFALAVVGALIGLQHLLFQTDVLMEDVRAYYDAGARLNAGQDLYVQPAGTDEAAFYRYPPLLAIVFRPLALLPYPWAAAIWGTLMVAAFTATLFIIGLRSSTWLALGILAMPILWSLTIGQAQVLVTLLLVVGAPWAVALAGYLKLLPFLVGLYWLGRREWPALGRMVAWTLVIGLAQLIVEPRGTVAYLAFPGLSQVGDVHNLSLFAISPYLWVGFLVAGTALTLYTARSKWGWPVAVAFSVLATPRLLTYQLSSLLAALRPPSSASATARTEQPS
jgi:hypothetical protein